MLFLLPIPVPSYLVPLLSVNVMDHNNNTALDYLAWELGQKWYQISKGRVFYY